LSHIYLTYEQLKAMKDVWNHAERVNWEAYEEFKQIILTAPLELREESAIPHAELEAQKV